MQKAGRVWVVIVALAGVAGLAAVGTGCGKASQTVADKATEKAIEKSIAKDGGKADVKIDSASGAMQMKGKDADGSSYEMKTGDNDTFEFKQTAADGTVTQMGASAKLPDDFPKDVPVMDGLQIQVVQASPQKKEYAVQGSSSTPLDKAAAFYKEKTAAQGWKETTSMNAGEMQTLVYEKDQRTLSVMLMKDGDKTTVSVQVGAQ